MTSTRGACFALAAVLAACGSKRGGDGEPASTVTASAVGAPTAKPTTATSAPSGAATAAPAERIDVAPPTIQPKMPEGRSAPPTLDEWSTLKKEVTVKGSSALRCETKILREYLRVSCRGKIVPEGTPTAIKLVRGGREAFVFATPGVASLIVPFVEGTDLEAVFSWTYKSHRLTAKWPKGTTQPVIVGTFEGAASPLDGTTTGDNAKLCACHRRLTGLSTCEELYGGADADCDRTYGDDCEKLLACARRDGSAPPRCQAGFVPLFGVMCRRQCGAGKPTCPTGQACAGATSTCE